MAEKDTENTPAATETPEETQGVAVETAEADEEKVTFVEDPTYKVDYKGDCAYEVAISIPPANTAEQTRKLFDELSEEATLPGFRPGRAPRKLVERKFGKHVRSEAEARLVAAAVEKILEDEKLKPMQTPELEGFEPDKERDEGAPIEFSIKFEVFPRVELGKYRGIEIERPVVAVDERDIDNAIDDIRNRRSTYEPLKTGKSKKGDQLVIDFIGKVDGEAFPGGTAADFPYVLGTKRFFPEFEEVLAGKSPGESCSCAVTFPETYHSEQVRGKTANFQITVKEVKRLKKPKVDDTFAKEAGFESVQDMRAKIKSELEAGSKLTSQRIAESRALETVISSSTFETPKSLIEDITESVHEEEVRRLMRARIPKAEIDKQDDELRAKARETAVQDIKHIITLNEIAEAEGLEITEEDFEREASDVAARTGLKSEMVARYLVSPDQRGSTAGRILRQKALALIVEHAKITDKEIPHDKLEEQAAEIEDE